LVEQIVIDGGETNAMGTNGAGIGAGFGYLGNSTVGSVTILSGNLSVSGTDGAGIGSGHGIHGSSTVGSITVKGGTITAIGLNGAGIGSGFTERGNSSVQDVRIENGIINARGTVGAGIGSGCSISTGNSVVGSVTILFGEIFASGNSGAGIGAGFSYFGNSTVTSVVVDGGTVRLFADDAAGIGAGYTVSGTSFVKTLVIRGGYIIATANRGAGVGAGCSKAGLSGVGTVLIEGGIIEAAAMGGAAGVGTGFAEQGNSTVDTFRITDGWVKATGGSDSAAIGSGVSAGGLSAIRSLVIEKGNVVLSGLVGVGSSRTGHVMAVELGPGSRYSEPLVVDCHARNDSCFAAQVIFIQNGPVNAVTDSKHFFSEGDFFQTGFYGQYRGTVLPESLGNVSRLQICGLTTLPNPLYRLEFKDITSDYSRTVEFRGSEMTGFIIALDRPSDYYISVYSSTGESLGRLCGDRGPSFMAAAGIVLLSGVELCGTAGKGHSRVATGVLIAVASVVVIAGAIAFLCWWRKKDRWLRGDWDTVRDEAELESKRP
jgi:hypothetical protein